jgi:hypothetical protein
MTSDQLRIRILLSDVGRAQGLFLFWPAVVSILPHALGTVGSSSPGKHSWKVHWLLLLYSVHEKFLVSLVTSRPRIDSGHPRYEAGVVTTWSWRSVLAGCRNLWRTTICMKCGQRSSFGCHRELYQAYSILNSSLQSMFLRIVSVYCRDAQIKSRVQSHTSD